MSATQISLERFIVYKVGRLSNLFILENEAKIGQT